LRSPVFGGQKKPVKRRGKKIGKKGKRKIQNIKNKIYFKK
jgi:hypothetical protein